MSTGTEKMLTCYDGLGPKERMFMDACIDILLEEGPEGLRANLPPGASVSENATERDRARRFIVGLIGATGLRLVYSEARQAVSWEVRMPLPTGWSEWRAISVASGTR